MVTKEQLVEKFSEFDGFESKEQAESAFDFLISTIKDGLETDRRVDLGDNFGIFTKMQHRSKKQYAESSNTSQLEHVSIRFSTSPKYTETSDKG